MEDDLSNSTTPFHNMTSDDYEELRRQQSFYNRFFLELFTLVGVLSITANVLLAFVILKYKRLREKVTNVILLHLVVMQSAYLFCTPTSLRLVMDFELHYHVNSQVFCVVEDFETVLLFGVFLFVILLLWEWYVKVHKEDKYPKFCHVYKFLVATNYVLCLFFLGVSAALCIERVYFSYVYNAMAVFAVFIVMILMIIVLNIVHRVKARKLTDKKHNNTGLVVANILILVWFPAFVASVLDFWDFSHPVVLILLIGLGFSSPVFNLLYLFNCDNDFNVFLRRVFRCECNDYRNESLEDNSITYNEENGVQINSNLHI